MDVRSSGAGIGALNNGPSMRLDVQDLVIVA
jgi:hypothetical protein